MNEIDIKIKIKRRTGEPYEGPRGAWWYIATWFGCGLSPFMSGTVGSLAALPFAFFIQYYFGGIALALVAWAIFAVGCWASQEYLKHTGRDDDPSEIVVDEVAGQWLLLAALPLSWQAYVIGFFVFRIFDIIKPWPVSYADRTIHGGVGVMFDDMLAALYPVVLFFILLLVIPTQAYDLMEMLWRSHDLMMIPDTVYDSMGGPDVQ